MLPPRLCVKNKDNIAVCLYVPRLIGFLSFWQPLSLHSNSFIFGEQPGHYVPTSIQSASLRPAVAVQRKHTLSAETKLSRLIMSNDSHIEFFRQAACQLTLGGRQGHHLTYRDKQLFTPTGNFHQLTKFSSLWSVGGSQSTWENTQTQEKTFKLHTERPFPAGGLELWTLNFEPVPYMAALPLLVCECV